MHHNQSPIKRFNLEVLKAGRKVRVKMKSIVQLLLTLVAIVAIA